MTVSVLRVKNFSSDWGGLSLRGSAQSLEKFLTRRTETVIPPGQAYEMGGDIQTAGETSTYPMGGGLEPDPPPHAYRNRGGGGIGSHQMKRRGGRRPPTFGAPALRVGEN